MHKHEKTMQNPFAEMANNMPKFRIDSIGFLQGKLDCDDENLL